MGMRAEDPWEREYRSRGRLWGGVRLDGLTAGVLDEEPGLSRGRWLDAGCGDGKGTVPLLERLDPQAPVAFALDASGSALRHARAATADRRGRDALRRISFIQGDVLHLPLAHGRFDAVRAVHLVGHMLRKEREQVMRRFLGLLRPGGLLLVSEFGTGDFRAGKGEEVEPGTYRRGTGIVTHYFTGEELEGLVRSSGAIVRSLDPQRFTVTYGGERLERERWDLVAVAPGPAQMTGASSSPNS